ncbi:MAG TPA: glycosyltransferase, partial [Sedimentisphaerales bacterium]|nr:glycosyltransferase [Sedimentisphaerales bacterium]
NQIVHGGGHGDYNLLVLAPSSVQEAVDLTVLAFDLAEKYRTIVVDEMRRAIEPVKDAISYRKIKRLLCELQPDIVHTHSAKAGIVGRFAAASLKGRWASNRPAIVHGIHGLSFHRYQNPWVNRFYIAIERATARRTDYFISVADAMTEQSKAAGIGVDKPYVTAYSAIDEERFMTLIPEAERAAFRRKYDIPADAIVLVTVARLFMLKGHDYIIESAQVLARRFPNVIWLFIGDGNLMDAYQQQIRNLGLADRFRFTGLMPPDQIPLAIQSSEILVHCSLREGLARTLPQAMLCGRPAISFDVDGAREVVNPDTGRLIEPKSVPQLIEACAELIRDKALRERLGRTAQESVKTKFAPNTMVDVIENVYRQLVLTASGAGKDRS